MTTLPTDHGERASWWRRLVSALPMRTALIAVAAVWVLGCVWSYTEQSAFAASKGFAFPHLLPLVIDGFAVSMAGVAWAASLDARPAVAARLATLVAVGASSASNGVWAWLRADHDLVAVALAVAVPVAANLAFEVLLAELRRQVQRRRGLPAPVAVPYPRLIRVVLAPWQTLRTWRVLVLDLTAVEHSLAPVTGKHPAGVGGQAAHSPGGVVPDGEDDLAERARRVVTTAERPIGRRRLARELEISEHHARQLLSQVSTEGDERLSEHSDPSPVPRLAFPELETAGRNGARHV
jgi:hypothetical protein